MKDYSRSIRNPFRITTQWFSALLLLLFSQASLAQLDVSPTFIDFRDVPTGTRGSATITLSASFTSVSNIVFVTFGSGVFNQTNNCPAILGVRQSCTVTVNFEPSNPKAYTGSIQINHRTGIDPIDQSKSVSLQGTGVEASWLTKPGSPLLFNDTPVNTSITQSFTLNNTGNGVSFIDSLIADGDYSVSFSTCDQQLNAGQSCSITVRFTPRAQGTRTGTFTASGRDSDGKTPLTATLDLSGFGLGSSLTLDPQSGLDFADVEVGTSSQPFPLGIVNKGTGSLSIGTISVTGGFTQTNNCGTTLASGESCTAQVIFTPPDAGPVNGSLTVSGLDTDGRSPISATADLRGNGSVSGNLETTPTSLNFPDTLIERTSTAQSVSINNTGSGPITIESIAVPDGFTQTNNCESVLGAGSSCTVDVRFRPFSVKTFNGTLLVRALDSDQATQLSAATLLTGRGFSDQTSNPYLTFSRSLLEFGNVVLNGASSMETIQVTNNNEITLTIQEISLLGEFSQTNDCPAALGYSESCTLTLQYLPQSAGQSTGSLIIETTDPNNTAYGEVIALSGFGVVENLGTSPQSVSFGPVAPGAENPSEVIVLTNNGNVEITIESISIAAPFSQSNDCPATLSVGYSCNITVTADTSQELGDALLTISTRSDGGVESFSTQVSISGDTYEPVDLADLLGAYSGDNPNVEALIDVIIDTCGSGRASDRLQSDCNAVIEAALEGDEETETALLQILPERSIKSSRLLQQGGETQSRNVNSRIAALRAGASGFSVSGLNFNINNQVMTADQLASLFRVGDTGGSAGQADGLFSSRLGGFISGTLVKGGKDGTTLDSGLDYRTTGLTAGLDYRVSDRLVLGGALGYMRTDTDLDNNGGNVDTRGFNITAYGTYYTEKGLYVDFSAGYGNNDFDQDRNIVFDLVSQGAVNQTASADYDGKLLNLSLGAGYDFNKNGWSFGPRFNLDYVRAEVDGFTETLSSPTSEGGGWATMIDETDQDWLTLKLGAKATYALSTRWGVMTPYAGFDWLHEFRNDAQVIMGGLAEDPESMMFGIRTDEPDRNYFQLSLGTSVVFNNGVIGFVNYDTILTNDDWDRQSINLGIRAEF